ncbi:MAG: transcriptional repressor LexA [Patescibacteria group bacterium]
MEKPITTRQKELLSIIYDYFKSMGYPPTFEEMRESLKVSSNQSIIDLLEKLEKSRLIKKSRDAARGITILPLGYKILDLPPLTAFLGVTSAGAPIQSLEVSGEWKETPSIDDKITKLDEEVFMLRISGDSMINADIENGDTVLVQTKKEFISGEIVYAQINDEGTVKRFISEDKPPYVYLKPENPKYENILFTDEVVLKGKIISVLKNNYWKLVK